MSHSISCPQPSRVSRRRLATVALLVAALTLPAPVFADVDLTGYWLVQYDWTIGIGDETGPAFVEQSGTSLSMSMLTAMTGSINPGAGTFHVGSPYNTPTPFGPCTGSDVYGTAAPDGNSMSGSGSVAVRGNPPHWCTTFHFTFTAHRDPCGNGVIDPGEACDDGNREWYADCCTPDCEIATVGSRCRVSGGACDPEDTCDGVSPLCPVNQLAPAGTTCRAAADACDVAETCTGTSPTCPPDAEPPDADGDGVVDPCDACPATPDAVLVKPRLELSSYDGVAGNDKLVLKTELPLSSAGAASLDPIGNGMAIEVGSLAVTVPGGAFDPLTRAGWRTVPAGNKWTFRGTDPLLAISSVAIKLTGTASAPRAIVKVTGKKRSFAQTLPALPLSLRIALDPPIATAVTCGAAGFSATGEPSPTCDLKAKDTALSCR